MFDIVSDKLIKIFEEIIQWMYDSFVEPFTDIPTLKNLVFGTYGEDSLVWGTFRPDDLTNGLTPLFYTMATLAGFFLIAGIVMYGMRIAGAPMNPGRRNESIEFVKDLLIVGIVLINLPLIYDLLFTINSAVVGMFSSAYDSNLDKLVEDRNDEISGVIGNIFVQLMLLGLMVWANFYYLMRKVTLIILMGIGPLMMVFWMYPQFKAITASWFKELVGSIFIQAIHAFVFWTVAVISMTSSGFIETVIVYLIFIPISEAIRRLLLMGGDMQNGLAKVGALYGMAGLGALYGSVKGALGDKTVMGALQGAYKGVKDKKAGGANGDAPANGELRDTLGANAGSDVGTTTRAEKMLRAGDIASRMGKATFGMAGAIAGSTMGPMSAMIGSSAAFAAGGAVTGVAGRATAGLAQGVQDRLKKGMDAAKGVGSADKGDFADNFANDVAKRETASWADSNRDSVMNDLRERFPDATPKELENHFNDMKANKHAGFAKQAKQQLASLKDSAPGLASGSAMVAASSEAMAQKWGDENQKDFFDEYDKTNPQKRGESQQNYLARRSSAFNQKRTAMKGAFAELGQEYVGQNAADGTEPISKQGFMDHMSQAVPKVQGIGKADGIADAGKQAVDHVQGASLFDKKGKPNAMFIAGGLAHAKTQQMKQAFMKQQGAQGISEEAALQDWEDNHKVPTHRQNLQAYKSSAEQAGSLSSASVSPIAGAGILQTARLNGAKATAFVGGATGLGKVAESLTTSAQAGISGFRVAREDLQAGEMSQTSSTLVPALKAGTREAFSALKPTGGDPVDRAMNVQNIAGYTAGIAFGAKGYQVGKGVAARFSPLQKNVQEAIQSPSEVIQMAQTVTDDNGNVRVAQGAIRQVITPNESYVEVRTKSGDTQRVSRKGAGHSGMRQGDVVYQDLDVQDDMLVVSAPKGSGSSTYRVDSGGGRVPSGVAVASNPNELLGSPRVSNSHRPTARQSIPSYSQAVDNGSFYTEDLQGFENIQVIVEKDRQFVAAQKDGMTYRVSPVFAGDTRLDAQQSIQIPMTMRNKRLQPVQTPNSHVAVQSQVIEGTQNVSYDTPSKPETPYYSTRSVNGLVVDDMMPSKHTERANRSANMRSELDQVRRKQGLLG